MSDSIVLFEPGDIAKGRDALYYGIHEAKHNKELPQMSRYTVQRLSDKVVIENFPGYLLKELEWRGGLLMQATQ